MRTHALLSIVALIQLVHTSLPFKSSPIARVGNSKQQVCTTTVLQLRTGENDGTDKERRRSISPDDIDSLFGGGSGSGSGSGSSQRKRGAVASEDADDTEYGYDYDYEDEDENVDGDGGNGASVSSSVTSDDSISATTSSSRSIAKDTTEVDGNSVDKIVDTARVGGETVIMKGKYKMDASMMDLVDLENAYHASRTAMPLPPSVGDIFVDDIESSAVRTKISSELNFETGLEYINLEQAADRRQSANMLDSMSITDKDGSVRSRSGAARDIPQYNPTDTVRYDPMQYGAYRRWKIAEKDVKNTKDSKRGKKKKQDTDKPDSFFDTIRNNLGAKPRDNGLKPARMDKNTKNIGQGFGTRAEPPKNMKSILPNKPVPKKNRKRRVITPDDIDSLFTKTTTIEDSEEEEEVGGADVDDEYEYENDENEDKSDVEVVGLEVKQPASQSFTVSSFSPSEMANEEIPKWLSDADKAAKQSKKIKRKKKGLTDDWRFWLALVGGVGFLSAAWSVYSQTGFNMGSLPGPQELII